LYGEYLRLGFATIERDQKLSVNLPLLQTVTERCRGDVLQ